MSGGGAALGRLPLTLCPLGRGSRTLSARSDWDRAVRDTRPAGYGGPNHPGEKEPVWRRPEKLGGAEGIRTPDLMTASHARSQLRHSPGKTIPYRGGRGLSSRLTLPGAPVTLDLLSLPGWRNWKTCQTQNLVGLAPVGVRLPLPAPILSAACFLPGARRAISRPNWATSSPTTFAPSGPATAELP